MKDKGWTVAMFAVVIGAFFTAVNVPVAFNESGLISFLGQPICTMNPSSAWFVAFVMNCIIAFILVMCCFLEIVEDKKA